MPVVAVDPFPEEASLTSSAKSVKQITPSDSDELPFVTKAVSIGVQGALSIVNSLGDTETYESGCFAIGVPLPMEVRKVLATGTTATKICAWMR